jgi:hypothetical protein
VSRYAPCRTWDDCVIRTYLGERLPSAEFSYSASLYPMAGRNVIRVYRLNSIRTALGFGLGMLVLLVTDPGTVPTGASTSSSMQSAAALISGDLGSDSAASAIVNANGADWLAVASEPASNIANGVNGQVKFGTYLWHDNAWHLQGSGILVDSSPDVTGVAVWEFSGLKGPVFAVSSEGGDSSSVSVIARVGGKWRAVPFVKNGTSADGVSPNSELKGPTNGDEIVFQQCEESCSTVTFKYSKGQFESESQPSTGHSSDGTNPIAHDSKSWTLKGNDFVGSPGFSYELSDIQVSSDGQVFALVTNSSDQVLTTNRLAGQFLIQISNVEFKILKLNSSEGGDGSCTKSSLIPGYVSCQAEVVGFATTYAGAAAGSFSLNPRSSEFIDIVGEDQRAFPPGVKSQDIGLAYVNGGAKKLLVKSFAGFMSGSDFSG